MLHKLQYVYMSLLVEVMCNMVILSGIDDEMTYTTLILIHVAAGGMMGSRCNALLPVNRSRFRIAKEAGLIMERR